MEVLKKWKKTLTRSKSSKEKNQTIKTTKYPNSLPRGKSWSSSSGHVPVGCFTVYVGPERERFVMKAKYANHPLFKMLLDDAEKQYGYSSEGPLLLPCDVDLFYKVLAEMDSDSTDVILPVGCGGCTYHRSYSLLSPSKFLKLNHF